MPRLMFTLPTREFTVSPIHTFLLALTLASAGCSMWRSCDCEPPKIESIADASYHGDLEAVNGADLNAVSQYGGTVVSGPSCAGHAGILKKLIRRGARVNVADRDGNTPLHEAATTYDDVGGSVSFQSQ